MNLKLKSDKISDELIAIKEGDTSMMLSKNTLMKI